jgi:hypothetical protein
MLLKTSLCMNRPTSCPLISRGENLLEMIPDILLIYPVNEPGGDAMPAIRRVLLEHAKLISR